MSDDQAYLDILLKPQANGDLSQWTAVGAQWVNVSQANEMPNPLVISLPNNIIHAGKVSLFKRTEPYVFCRPASRVTVEVRARWGAWNPNDPNPRMATVLKYNGVTMQGADINLANDFTAYQHAFDGLIVKDGADIQWGVIDINGYGLQVVDYCVALAGIHKGRRFGPFPRRIR